MTDFRMFSVFAVAAALAIGTSACAVRTTEPAPTRQYSWNFYPAYDVYYSPTAALWVYWTGSHWVTVDRPPRALRVASTAYYTPIDYYGPQPWAYWDRHRYLYPPAYRHVAPVRPRPQPRTWRGPVDERGIPRGAPERGVTPTPRPARPTRPAPSPPARGPIDERGLNPHGGGDDSREWHRGAPPQPSGRAADER